MSSCAKYLSVAALATTLAACGGDSNTAATGTVSIGLTDAPVDHVTEVNIVVTGVELKPETGSSVQFVLEEPADINLLDLQGGQVLALVTTEEVPAGNYSWMRLKLGDQSLFSVTEVTGGIEGLRVPSGDQRGLQTSGFVVPAGGEASFTIDFDVRKSLIYPPGQNQYLLRPTLRLVDNAEVGTLTGTVDPTLVAAACSEAGNNPSTFAGAVYVYSGDNAETGDLGSDNEPLTVAPISTSTFGFIATFLPQGSYTIAYTCDSDDPEEADEELTFSLPQSLVVIAGESSDIEIME